MKNLRLNGFSLRVVFSSLLFSSLLFSSCEKEVLEEENINNQAKTKLFSDIKFSSEDKLKEKFGRALGKALKENEDLRSLLKSKALKKFNKDFDVMYHLIKNETLSGNYQRGTNQTQSYNDVRSLLVNYFDNPNDLVEIERSLPLLTIFIPELPNNTFSAATWDTSDPSQAPTVAIRLNDSNEVPMIDTIRDFDYVLAADLIPSFPVVVIKNNERLVVDSPNHNYANSTEVISGGDYSYRFLDNNLNVRLTPISQIIDDNPVIIGTNPVGGGGNTFVPNPNLPCEVPFPILQGRHTTVAPFLTTAHNIFENTPQAWQRDNIYYRLTPTQTTNSFVGGKYREAITYFQLTGSVNEVFNFIASQEVGGNPDPQANNSWNTTPQAPWTDGNFEIGISIIDNSKNRSKINTTLAFDAAPSSLFHFSYVAFSIPFPRPPGFIIGNWPTSFTFFRPVLTGFKGMSFLSNNINATNLISNVWDLTEYSNIWNYEFKEIDATVQVDSQNSSQKKYNSNLAIDASFPLGDKIKIGLKYGSTNEITDTSLRTYKWVQGSNFLGSLDINFFDKILLKNPCNNLLYPRLYTTSRVLFEVRPVQVEF